MVFQILKNKLKIKYIISLIIILSALVSISYSTTYTGLKSKIQIYNSNATDVNMEYLKDAIDSNSGLTYVFEFLFSSDVIILFTIVFSVASIALFGIDLIRDISNGFGNSIISRIGYNKYLRCNIGAQVIFNYGFLIVYFSLLFIISYLINGNLNIENGLGIGEVELIIMDGAIAYFFIMIVKVILFATIISLITVSSSLTYTYIKNRFFVQLFPLIYYFVTLMVGGILLNSVSGVSNIIESLILDVQILSVMKSGIVIESNNLLKVLGFIVFMGGISIILYRKNISKFSKEYVL